MTASLVLEGKDMNENLTLRISRVIQAKRERVYDAWTRPELIQQWFGPENISVATASNDLRVGGAYRIEMKGLTADDVGGPVAAGIYKKIVPNELLCFTWHADWQPSEETLVTVTFKDAEGGTEVTVTHERFATVESRSKHEHGWAGSLEKLAQFYEKK